MPNPNSETSEYRLGPAYFQIKLDVMRFLIWIVLVVQSPAA
jgi:hypothetical protein